jgi:Cu(I)/Ag(I) efflux system membrane protein CusA/SilA
MHSTNSAKIASGGTNCTKGININLQERMKINSSRKTLFVVVPLALLIIFFNLYFQFRSVSTSPMIFTGISVGVCRILIMMVVWSRMVLNFSFSWRKTYEVLFFLIWKTINLSVMKFVGFIALFGIATDDGVEDGNLSKLW